MAVVKSLDKMGKADYRSPKKMGNKIPTFLTFNGTWLRLHLFGATRAQAAQKGSQGAGRLVGRGAVATDAAAVEAGSGSRGPTPSPNIDDRSDSVNTLPEFPIQ